MRNVCIFVGAILLAVGTLATADEPRCEVAKPIYAIESWIVGVDSTGKELALAAPKVAVYEGEQASIRDVSQIPRPGKTENIEWLEEGTSIDVKIFRDDDGQRFLDARVELTGRPAVASQKDSCAASLARYVPSWFWQPTTDPPVGVRLVTSAVTLIEPVKLGEKIAVRLSDEGQHRVELRVSEIAPQDLTCARHGEPVLDFSDLTPRGIILEEEEPVLGIEVAS